MARWAMPSPFYVLKGKNSDPRHQHSQFETGPLAALVGNWESLRGALDQFLRKMNIYQMTRIRLSGSHAMKIGRLPSLLAY
jgi:hypothetical protein